MVRGYLKENTENEQTVAFISENKGSCALV